MGFWDAFKDIAGQLPEIAKSLKELSEDENFQKHLGYAGAIGGLCVIGLDIANKIKSNLQTPEKRAFAAVLKIVFESTKDALPNNDKIELKDIKTEDLINELLYIFTETGYKWDLDLPSHPVISQYRKHLSYVLTYNPEYNDIDPTTLFIKFNTLLEDKAIVDPDVKEFYKRSQLDGLSDNLRQYLEYVRSTKDELNPVDHKSYMDYYVQNRAVLVLKDTWYKEDNDIPPDKQWTVESFLHATEYWHIIIGAPFGIGKTSLAKHIAVDYATRYLNEPGSVHIPVFVLLKDKLDNVFYDNNLDYVLDTIIAPSQATKNRKILLICDGLDEYFDSHNEGSRTNVASLFEELREKRKKYPNMKIIITTRLEAGLPETLHIKHYVRLLPFDSKQVNEFFEKYYYHHKPTPLKFEDIQEYGLKEEEIFKPLFCWMLTRIESEFDLSTLENVLDQKAKRSLIYQQFIHSTIIGKHRELGGRERFGTELEYNMLKEKKILRKIAPLKMMYGDKLTQQILTNELSKFEDVSMSSSSRDQNIQQKLAPIISSYFYLTSQEPYAKIDFIHESFKEYLLAGYYIESLLLNKPYRLSVGIPSFETMLFLDGLLEFFIEDKENGQTSSSRSLLEQEKNRFLKSLLPSPSDKQVIISKLKSDLVANAFSSFNNEQIVFDIKSKGQEKEFWDTVVLPSSKYPELWIHRWLCLSILTKFVCEADIDSAVLSDFILKTGQTVPGFLKRLIGLNLASEILSYANLSDADLRKANLSSADLSYANLAYANLAHANLSFVHLTYANLYKANLYKANLSSADLSYANLYKADLRKANLSSADLTGANLWDADLSDAMLSNALLSDVYNESTNVDRKYLIKSSTPKRITRYTSNGKPILNQGEY